MCDKETYEAAKDVVEFQTHLGIPLKGFSTVSLSGILDDHLGVRQS